MKPLFDGLVEVPTVKPPRPFFVKMRVQLMIPSISSGPVYGDLVTVKSTCLRFPVYLSVPAIFFNGGVRRVCNGFLRGDELRNQTYQLNSVILFDDSLCHTELISPFFAH